MKVGQSVNEGEDEKEGELVQAASFGSFACKKTSLKEREWVRPSY